MSMLKTEYKSKLYDSDVDEKLHDNYMALYKAIVGVTIDGKTYYPSVDKTTSAYKLKEKVEEQENAPSYTRKEVENMNRKVSKGPISIVFKTIEDAAMCFGVKPKTIDAYMSYSKRGDHKNGWIWEWTEEKPNWNGSYIGTYKSRKIVKITYPDGTVFEFESLTDCEKHLNISRNTLNYYLGKCMYKDIKLERIK